MRADTPSRTAAWVAACRSYGSLLPDHVRLADDPYGARFAPEAPLGLAPDRVPLDPRFPGALAVKWLMPLRRWVMYMQVRTRVIDDVLLEFVRDGGRQVVLLGAGFDCRALRFAGELDGATVFEVDHPATQGHKQRVLGDEGLAAPVRYLTWDFEARPLAELPAALAAIGHDPAAPTLTIWEGVTMYLSERAIDETVRTVRAMSAPGSAMAITYVTREVIERPGLVGRVASAVVARVGEPWRFGWDPAELPAWMRARGFALERDVSIADAARELLPPWWARGVGEYGRRIALARTLVESIAVARPAG